MKITTRRRDLDGRPIEATENFDPKHTAIVIIDAWEYHWCNTWCGLAGGRIPRLNRAISGARALGFTIIHSPTDVATSYCGVPQRERMAALPRIPMPTATPAQMPAFPEGEGGPRAKHCMCAGTFCCTPNYGQLNLDPRLEIAPGDLISGDGVEIYTWCKTHEITHLIICGFATNICMPYKPEGVVYMTQAGLRCVFARDQTEAHGNNTGAESADRYTTACVNHLEKHGCDSIDLAAELSKAGKWDEKELLDPVRIVPWGLERRACFFDESVSLSMSFPLHQNATIHYTTDGSAPTPKSPKYVGPFVLKDSCVVRAAAFTADGKPAGSVSESHYARRPAIVPKPDVYLSELKVTKQIMWGWYEPWSHPLNGSDPPPQTDRAYRGGPLTLHGIRYGKGISVHAPAQTVYSIEPRFGRFVATVGIDEGILLRDLGRGYAAFPSVIFKVFVDGELAGQSPLMRIGVAPWRFDISIPQGAKTISLVSDDGGDGNREDIANWVDVGFVLRK